MDGYLLDARYCTRTGRQGQRRVIIDAEDMLSANALLQARLERQGATKIDITNYGKANHDN